MLLCFLMVSCAEKSPGLGRDSFLSIEIGAGMLAVQAQTGILPAGYAFFDLEGIRNSSLVALLENYGGTLNAAGCMRDILENAKNVQMVFDDREFIVFSRQNAEKKEFSGVVRVDGTDIYTLPNCGEIGGKWKKQEDGSYVGSFGRFAVNTWKWSFPQRKDGLILAGADDRMEMQITVHLENGFHGNAFFVFRSANLAQGIEKQVSMFRKQLASHRKLKGLAEKIRVRRENERFALHVSWSRHDVRQLLQALGRRR